jgi:hypothetical protein
MLRGAGYADVSPVRPGDLTDPIPDPLPRLAADQVPERPWLSGEDGIEPRAWQFVADSEWETAITSSRQAPPDGRFTTRLKLITRAATTMAKALGRLDADDMVWWDEAPLNAESGLSYELRPGANRPGPPELWDRFDARVQELAAAAEAGRAGAISAALSELAIILHDIVEELKRYRGPDGGWLAHPPENVGGESPEPSDQDLPATDGRVS